MSWPATDAEFVRASTREKVVWQVRSLPIGFILTLTCIQLVRAQVSPGGVASVVVDVIDSTSGKPIPRLTFYNRRISDGSEYGTTYRTVADTTGRLQLDSIPAGVPQHFQVICDQGLFRGKLLDSVTTTLQPGEVRKWLVRSSASGCDQRPFLVRRGMFTGHWRSGFEESRFVPCDSVIPEAWACLLPGAGDLVAERWPKGLDAYYPEVFVRWEGVLKGPWHYGHLGVSDYQITVERILEVRKPSAGDCETP